MSDDIDVNHFSESLNDKMDRDAYNADHDAFYNLSRSSYIDYVIEFVPPTAENGYKWSRLYASGWLEQGGIITDNSTTSVSINLLKPYSDTNYSIQLTQHYGGNAYPANISGTWTENSFTVYKVATVKDFWWETKGMAATQGE